MVVQWQLGFATALTLCFINMYSVQQYYVLYLVANIVLFLYCKYHVGCLTVDRRELLIPALQLSETTLPVCFKPKAVNNEEASSCNIKVNGPVRVFDSGKKIIIKLITPRNTRRSLPKNSSTMRSITPLLSIAKQKFALINLYDVYSSFS